MTEYKKILQRHIKILLYLLSLYALGWGFTPWQSAFNGLLLGTVGSVYFLLSTYRKINRMGQAIVEQRRTMSLGSLQRVAVAGLVVLIALRFPQTFDLIFVILGLMTFSIVILIDILLQSIRNQTRKRGE